MLKFYYKHVMIQRCRQFNVYNTEDTNKRTAEMINLLSSHSEVEDVAYFPEHALSGLPPHDVVRLQPRPPEEL